jgi:hypothetical protein
MAFDTSLIDGVTYTGPHVAAVSGFTDNGNGTFTLDGSTYGGAFNDFYTGPSGTANPTDIASVLLHAYNPTLAPGIVTYTLIQANGTPVNGGTFGGDVLGWGPHSLLIEQIPNFVSIDQATGQYAGQLNPNYALWLSNSDISFESNGGNGPNFPVTFASSGPFSVSAAPEPATWALVVVALLAVTLVRAPWLRRMFSHSVFSHAT